MPPCWRSAAQAGAHRRDRRRGWPMRCDFVAVGTRAWQAEASEAGRALSTPGLFVGGNRASGTELHRPDAALLYDFRALPPRSRIRAMKLFSRLFRNAPPPPPAPPTLAERVAGMQTARPEIVVAAALDGKDADVPPALRQAARERLARLIDDGTIDFAAFCSGREPWSDKLTVAALCKDPSRLREALARIEDPSMLARLVTDSPSSRMRQAAASAIEHPAQLHELLPRVRGRDKTVYRIIRQKCDALNAERRRAEDAARAAEELCASLEQHGARPHGPLYEATLEALTARWCALAVRPEPSVERRIEEALGRCREVIAAHEREVARQASARAAEREAREARERVLEAERRAAEEKAEAEAQARAAAAAVREAEQRTQAEQRAAEAAAQREIGSLIRLASDALNRGNSRKAARFRQAIEDALQAAPALPPYLSRALQQLDERLNELKQWKDYVVAPKRIELIEEMEALVGSPEDPESLVEHIRALQQEWRTINKGIASDAPGETERFQQAFQAAFKPCQEYFAEQAAVRRQNLAARIQVLERLKAFETSQQEEQPDFPLIAQVLREAPREWRSHSPVDREASRSPEIEFQQSLDRLRRVLNAWYERNEADKQSLITQARHLATAEDTTQAVDGLKQLQALWKETGPASRDRSQAMWEEFRGLCDAVYQRRAEAHAQYSASLEAAKKQAAALCEQIEQAAGMPAADRLPGPAKIAEWRAEFDEIGELPRADARSLRDRFGRAISRYEQGLAEQDRRDIEAAESNLFEAGRLIRAYERAVIQGVASVDRAALKNAAESFVAGVHRWPRGGMQAVKQALSRADSATDVDDAACERALRTLCIRCEILASTPTPPGDEALRQDCEMRLLMERMGQARHDDERERDDLLLEWIAIGAAAPDVHEQFEDRFRRALAQRPAQAHRNHGQGSARPRW